MMMFDPITSHRTYNEPVKWWARNENEEIDNNELVSKRNPTGIFWAKEVSAETDSNNVVAGAFMFERHSVTLRTPDNIEQLRPNDIVTYHNDVWRVADIQKRKIRNQYSEFANDDNTRHIWFVVLRA